MYVTYDLISLLLCGIYYKLTKRAIHYRGLYKDSQYCNTADSNSSRPTGILFIFARHVHNIEQVKKNR